MTNRTLRKHLAKAYEIGMAQISDEIRGLARLVEGLRARTFLEIGTDRGGTFYLLCQLTDPSGTRISVDLPGGPFGSLERDRAEERNRMMQTWGEHVHILDRDSHNPDTLKEVEAILNGQQCDFLFVDGDHTYEGVRLDYEMYSSLVRPGGYIFFHDIVDTPQHRAQNCNVAKLWKELSGTKRTFCAKQVWGGIGVLRVSGGEEKRGLMRRLTAWLTHET